MAAAEVRQRVGLRVWGPIARFCWSPLLDIHKRSLTSRAHAWPFPPQTATAFFPAPRPTEGRFVPISAREEQQQQ